MGRKLLKQLSVHIIISLLSMLLITGCGSENVNNSIQSIGLQIKQDEFVNQWNEAALSIDSALVINEGKLNMVNSVWYSWDMRPNGPLISMSGVKERDWITEINLLGPKKSDSLLPTDNRLFSAWEVATAAVNPDLDQTELRDILQQLGFPSDPSNIKDKVLVIDHHQYIISVLGSKGINHIMYTIR